MKVILGLLLIALSANAAMDEANGTCEQRYQNCVERAAQSGWGTAYIIARFCKPEYDACMSGRSAENVSDADSYQDCLNQCESTGWPGKRYCEIYCAKQFKPQE